MANFSQLTSIYEEKFMSSQNGMVVLLLIVSIIFTFLLIAFRYLYKYLPKIKLTIKEIKFTDIDYNGRRNSTCTVMFDSADKKRSLVLGHYLTQRLMMKQQADNLVIPKTINYHYVPGLKNLCGYYDFECFLLPLKFYFITLSALVFMLILFILKPV